MWVRSAGGTWQGVYMGEHRDSPEPRKLVELGIATFRCVRARWRASGLLREESAPN